MPSEDLSDGICGKTYAQAGQKKTSRQLKRLIPHIRPVISKLSKSFISRVRTPFLEKQRLFLPGRLPHGVYTAAARIAVRRR
ncbi:hypothetical protein SE146_10270 [Neisseria gonorrhoeae]|uniref:hypothetical protein n=1 Tax=Neisseria gonorrhoeae TaxID=485 RepID=UPI0029C0A09C|nr:hypothetical protein [Neisseria gonorrhoeae]WPF73414.1 hypothetical protein SE146_10270 [Neisseria gonorrhoeae]